MEKRTFVIDYKDENGQDRYQEHYITGPTIEAVGSLTDDEVVKVFYGFYFVRACTVTAIQEISGGYTYAQTKAMHEAGKTQEALKLTRIICVDSEEFKNVMENVSKDF